MHNFVFTNCIIMGKKLPVKLRLGMNIRKLRELRKLSAEALADDLDISASGLYSYESGRTEPDATMLIRISTYFNVSIDVLLKGDLAKTDIDSLMKLGTNRILFPVLLDEKRNDTIEVVPAKAIAGYTTGYSDPEYISALTAFQLPFLSQSKKYRAFQIEGDSMLPIAPRSYVIAEYVENPREELKEGGLYILLLLNEGIVFKAVYKSKKNRKKLLLRSLNPAYNAYEIEWGDLKEAWRFVNYISSELPVNKSGKDVFLKLLELEKQVALITERVRA